ncbi:MAG: ATP-binding cassette domain-containing protein, partial [Candidatus Margulisiibacteriota bacterium]
VIGKNGKGKSTLLRLLAGELTPTAGEIIRHPACQLGYFGQTNIERLNPQHTIEEELAELRPDLNYSTIRKTCGAMMFSGDLALKPISILSGGEKSRVSLGKILLSPTNLLLLDEPTNHLDVESCDSMIAALDVFPGTVLIVTHSEMFLHHLAKKLIVFDQDLFFVFYGTYQYFLDQVGWAEEGKKQKKPKITSAQQQYQKQHQAVINKAKQIEKMIADEEIALAAVQLKMAAAASKGKGHEIPQLKQKAAQHQAALDAGFKELEALISELDTLDHSSQSSP